MEERSKTVSEVSVGVRVGHRELYLTRPYLQGSDVLAVQRRLQELGYDPQVLDGFFGPITEEATVAFQRARRLETSGVVSDQTYRALGFTPSSPTPPSPGGPWGRPKDISILIDTVSRAMTVSSGKTVVRSYRVAVGKPSTPTPPGTWKVLTKVVNPDWNVLGTRWMGLNIPTGNYGIHGTNNPSSIGHAVSNGCIRLHNHNVEELFEWARIGTPVRIVRGGSGDSGSGSPGGTPGAGPRPVLSIGSTGPYVTDLQRKLRDFGVYNGAVDGIFGPLTQRAVMAFQQSRNLTADGVVGAWTWSALGY